MPTAHLHNPSRIDATMDYVDDLPHLARVRIPRWTGQNKENLSFEIHGFADASSHAYAAVVYLRVIHSLSNFQVSPICAKTKVASVETIGIPCLELNAVVFLCRLLTCTKLSLSNVPIYGWTDSTITSAWLKQHPSKWNIYIANHHVSSKENLADCASRGLSAAMLLSHDLWRNGSLLVKRTSPTWPKPHLIQRCQSSRRLRKKFPQKRERLPYIN